MHASEPGTGADDIYSMRASLAPNVVFREFPSETVVLNLATGTYHGVNPVGGRILALLEELPSIRALVAQLAAEFDRPSEVIARDLAEFCHALSDRGLIELCATD